MSGKNDKQISQEPQNSGGNGNETDETFVKIASLSAGLVERGLADAEEDFDPVSTALRAIDNLTEERDSVKRQLSAQKGAATKAREAAAAAEAKLPPEPRSFEDDGDTLPPSELLELIEDADELEIVFVDRELREVPGLPPRKISGAGGAWLVRGSTLRLTVPDLQVHGPGPGQPPFRVHGYVLLADGEQVAAHQRHEPLAIAAGQTMQLKDDIGF